MVSSVAVQYVFDDSGDLIQRKRTDLSSKDCIHGRYRTMALFQKLMSSMISRHLFLGIRTDDSSDEHRSLLTGLMLQDRPLLGSD